MSQSLFGRGLLLTFQLYIASVCLPICAVSTTSENSSIKTLKDTSRGFTHVAKEALPAVVAIKVKHAPQNRPLDLMQSPENMHDEFLRRFFGLPVPPPKDHTPSFGFGSGVITSQDGYILTNNHVINNAKEITVILHSGEEKPGVLVGKDPDTDLAVVKIEGSNLPYLKLANSDDLEIGEWVIAIGAPQGLRSTLTVGVVSAKGRNDLNLALVEEFIQTDAAINPGNSGGPLINVDGNIIGINTAIFSNTGGYMGIGFAIPSNIANHVLEQLIENGSVKRTFLGVSIKPINHEMADAYQLEKAEGFFITEIIPDSPAQKAGLKWGDIILEIDGQPLKNYGNLQKILAFSKAGTVLNMKVNREGNIINVPVTLEYSSQATPAMNPLTTFGLEVVEQQSSVREKELVISEIIPGTAAYRAGIKPGCVLIAINRQRVHSIQECLELMKQSVQDQKVLLMLKDSRGTYFVSLKL